MPLPSEVKGQSSYSGLQSPNMGLLSLADNLNVPSSHYRVFFSISTCFDLCCRVFLSVGEPGVNLGIQRYSSTEA